MHGYAISIVSLQGDNPVSYYMSFLFTEQRSCESIHVLMFDANFRPCVK